MLRRNHSLVLLLFAAVAVATPASADIRKGKLAAQDLTSHYDLKRTRPEALARKTPAACAAIASPNPEEAALAKRLTLLGLCATAPAPSDESAPPPSEDKGPAPSFIQGQGACSVVGKVGQSC